MDDELADSMELLVQPDTGDDIDAAAAAVDNATGIAAAAVEVASPALFIEFGTGAGLN